MAIECVHIYKSYEDENIFTNLNLSFAHGFMAAIMGKSGRGKTTLINLIAGFLEADYGEIRGIAGMRLSMVFQEDRLLEHLSGLDNLLIVENDRERALQLLAKAGLADDANKKSAEYSGGMRRRLALCRALMIDFDFLILDEPFKGLDEKIKPQIMEMTRAATMDKTAILVTHRLGSARIADRIIVMDGGKIAGIGAHRELMDSCEIYADLYDSQAGWYRE